jgi:F0F1-type ATP synthase delta subunit
MANRKLFNSKNIVNLIENLLQNGKQDLVMQILKKNELKNLLPKIIEILERKSLKETDYKLTKIFVKTELSSEALQKIGENLNIDTKGAKIIIDRNMSAGAKIKSRDRLIDASLETMLQKGIEELLANQ